MTQSFTSALCSRWRHESFVCIGLDIDSEKLPAIFKNISDEQERVTTFAKEMVDATHRYACAYKLNSAHYERLGAAGYESMKDIITYIHVSRPGIPVILDAKRGDIDTTNEYYAKALFDELGADAVTVHPYMGGQSLKPFLSRKEKGVIVMAVNTTPGADEFQSISVGSADIPLYEYVCRQVAADWNVNGNCAVTASALDTNTLLRVRAAIGEMPILLLGVGAQGGNTIESVGCGRAKKSLGLIINASRSIIYASSGSDYREASIEAARKLNDDIRQAATAKHD